MKKLACIFLCVCTIICVNTGASADYSPTVAKTELGIPLLSYYPNESGKYYIFARNPWDMAVIGGKVFAGCGDYAANTGACPMYYFENGSKNAVLTGMLDTEQIARFYLFDDGLRSVAIDPLVWGTGETYLYNKQGWTTENKLSGNIHCYDMAKFDGKTFFCGSVTDYNKYSMISYFDANGQEHGVNLYKNGNPLPTASYYEIEKPTPIYDDESERVIYITIQRGGTYRVYDLTVYKNELYAWHYTTDYVDTYDYNSDTDEYTLASSQVYYGINTGIYKYDKSSDRFNFCADKTLTPVTKHKKSNEDYMFVQHKLEFNGRMVFVNNGLFVTDNLANYEQLFPCGDEDAVVRDCIVLGGKLYLLASRKAVAGDINGDGKTNAKDALLLRKRLAFYDEPTAFDEAQDINCDGSVNAKDLLCLRKVIAGIIVQDADRFYTTYVYETEDLVNFSKAFCFNATAYMKSFEYTDGCFYFGAGTALTDANPECGRMYRVDYPVKNF